MKACRKALEDTRNAKRRATYTLEKNDAMSADAANLQRRTTLTRGAALARGEPSGDVAGGDEERRGWEDVVV